MPSKWAGAIEAGRAAELDSGDAIEHKWRTDWLSRRTRSAGGCGGADSLKLPPVSTKKSEVLTRHLVETAKKDPTAAAQILALLAVRRE